MARDRADIQDPAESAPAPEEATGRTGSADPSRRAGDEPAFRVRSWFELVVPPPLRVHLSTPQGPAASALREKDLLSSGDVASDNKFTVEQHLDLLAERVGLAKDRPLLSLGLRNNLVNPRAMVCLDDTPLAVVGEAPKRSRRPYFGIRCRQGRFSMDVWRASDPPEPGFFCAGIPVLWDDLGADQLFGLILTEASDHSHVFRLPRGNHPEATDASRGMWRRLHDVFLANLHEDQATAEARMRQELESFDRPPQRDRGYLHSVLGVDREGRLVNIVGHGQLEKLGRAAAARGCRRAVCVENSGSISPTFFPEGRTGEAIPLLRAPNFRPRGRVYLFLELPSPTFGPLAPVAADGR